jgi:hypothetical protein
VKQLESLVLQYLFTPNRYRTLTLLAVKHPDTNWSAFPEATSIVCYSRALSSSIYLRLIGTER